MSDVEQANMDTGTMKEMIKNVGSAVVQSIMAVVTISLAAVSASWLVSEFYDVIVASSSSALGWACAILVAAILTLAVAQSRLKRIWNGLGPVVTISLAAVSASWLVTEFYDVIDASSTSKTRLDIFIVLMKLLGLLGALVGGILYANDKIHEQEIKRSTVTVYFHRLAGKGPARSFGWTPVIHCRINELLTSDECVRRLSTLLENPDRYHHTDDPRHDGERKIGDLCVVKGLNKSGHVDVALDLTHAVAAKLNVVRCGAPVTTLETVVMAITQEPQPLPDGGSNCTLGIFLVSERDLDTIHRSRTPPRGTSHCAGISNPDGIAFCQGAFRDSSIVRWQAIKTMAKAWHKHKESCRAHFERVREDESENFPPHRGAKGLDAVGTLRSERKKFQKVHRDGSAISQGQTEAKDIDSFLWAPHWVAGESDHPHLTAFTHLC